MGFVSLHGVFHFLPGAIIIPKTRVKRGRVFAHTYSSFSGLDKSKGRKSSENSHADSVLGLGDIFPARTEGTVARVVSFADSKGDKKMMMLLFQLKRKRRFFYSLLFLSRPERRFY